MCWYTVFRPPSLQALHPILLISLHFRTRAHPLRPVCVSDPLLCVSCSVVLFDRPSLSFSVLLSAVVFMCGHLTCFLLLPQPVDSRVKKATFMRNGYRSRLRHFPFLPDELLVLQAVRLAHSPIMQHVQYFTFTQM